MRSIWKLLALWICLAALGCKSAMITATISNRRTTPVSLIEVDYPSASFGTQKLEPGAEYHYRFKVIGEGPATVVWNEGRDQKKSTGPVLHEDDAGTLKLTFTNDANPTWDVELTNRTVR